MSAGEGWANSYVPLWQYVDDLFPKYQGRIVENGSWFNTSF